MNYVEGTKRKKMRKVKNVLDLPVFTALMFTIVLLLLFLATSPSLSMAGDRNIAEYLSSSKIKTGFFFISPVLAAFLRLLNKIYIANWWSIFSVVEMFLGVYIIIWFINKRYKTYGWIIRILLSELFCVFFWEAILKYEINFTQTSSIVSISGFLLIADCCYERADKGVVIIKIFWGLCFIMLSGAIRWKASLLMLPFEIMCFIYIFVFPCTLTNVCESLKDSYRNKKYLIMVVGIVTICVLLSDGLHKVYTVMNPQLGEYVEANALREDIADYIDRYPTYEDATMLYEELGIKKSWINMLYTFLTGDLNYFSSTDLNKMAGLKRESKKTVGEFIDTFNGHKILWVDIVAICIMVIILRGWKNSFLPFLGCSLSFFSAGLYFVHIGRFAWRVTNGCLLVCMVAFIVMSAWPVCIQMPRKFNMYVKTGILACILMIAIIEGISVKADKKELRSPKAEILDQNLADTLEYINCNSNILYLTVDSNFRFYSAYNMWSSHMPEYLENSFSLVAHFIMGGKETLQDRGVDNIINDMLEKPSIYLKYSPTRNSIFYDYLSEYYDPCITLSIVDAYKDTKFLRCSKPVKARRVKDYSDSINVALNKTDDFLMDKKIADSIAVSFEIHGGYKDYYLNVTDNSSGLIYSYGLKLNGRICSGIILQMKSTWEFDNALAVLIGVDADGNCDMIADISRNFADLE